MFCSKCGKQIADEAIICPTCGCATANYHTTDTSHKPTQTSTYSEDYIALKAFEEKVNSLYSLSIVSLVLFLGIGLIFSLVVWTKAKSIDIPRITTSNPNEIAMYESLKRKLKKAIGFSYFSMYPLLILLAPAAIFGGEYGMAVLIFAVYIVFLLISQSCTKALNQELKDTL
ncbi:MAG: zinc ribbon domain-containing protein [Oscillospiraceae bacterium]|nr:zinc ribbon domain-containing protein [Oscillospiraceae bacterium]MBQ9929624.1 zinc ribbon domain-containing protein [Oscillospiraceae bacterium]